MVAKVGYGSEGWLTSATGSGVRGTGHAACPPRPTRTVTVHRLGLAESDVRVRLRVRLHCPSSQSESDPGSGQVAPIEESESLALSAAGEPESGWQTRDGAGPDPTGHAVGGPGPGGIRS